MHRTRLAYSVSGSPLRGTMVLFHGVTDSAFSLTDFAQHYHSDWKVICVDTLGHGLSPRFSSKDLQDPFTAMLKAAAETLVKIADQTPGEKVVLCGHSLGGALAAHLAAKFPHLISGVVLEDPALLTPEQVRLYRSDAPELLKKQRNVRKYLGTSIDSLREAYPNWPETEYTGWAQGKLQVDLDFIATGVVGTPGREVLQNLKIPALLVTGDSDDVLFGKSGLDQVRGYGNELIDCIQISDATHTVRRDQSIKFYALLDSFLDSIVSHPAQTPPKPYLDSKLKSVIAQTPEQTTWDPQLMRIKGEEILGRRKNLPAGISAAHVQTGSISSRLIQSDSTERTQRIFLAIHGGGYVAGKAIYDDSRNSELVMNLPGTIVIAPDYRLAPESIYPNPVHDCLEALNYCRREYQQIPIYLYGDSAGAGLVNQMMQLCDTDALSDINGIIALEPCLDPAMDTQSYATYRDGPIWTREAGASAWKTYLGQSDDTWLLTPNIHPHLLPPLIVFVNPADPLRDEGISWVTRQMDLGAQASLHIFSGTFHGALSVPGTRVWQQVLNQIKEFTEQLEGSRQ